MIPDMTCDASSEVVLYADITLKRIFLCVLSSKFLYFFILRAPCHIGAAYKRIECTAPLSIVLLYDPGPPILGISFDICISLFSAFSTVLFT